MTDSRRLLPTGAAARAVGIGRSTLWRWIGNGWIEIHHRTAGGHPRWDVDRLRREIDELARLHAAHQEDALTAEPHTAADPEKQPVVAAIVTSHKGVLVGRRHDGKPLWGFISGEIEPGEASTDAAVREVKEETGLLVRSARQEIGRRVHPHTGRTMIYLACQPTEGTDVFVGDADELAEVRWVPSMEELLTLIKREHLFDPVAEHLARVL